MDSESVVDVAAADIEKAHAGIELLRNRKVLAFRGAGGESGIEARAGIVGAGDRVLRNRQRAAQRGHPVIPRGECMQERGKQYGGDDSETTRHETDRRRRQRNKLLIHGF